MSTPAPSRRAWRWVRWALIALLAVANLAIVYALIQVNSIDEKIAEAVATVPDVEPVLDQPPPDPQDPLIVLVIGSDSRENLPDEWVGDFGEFGGQRADVIMLVHLVPATGDMRLMSVPRDLRVEIEGYGTQKINAAYAFGGAPLMVTTVKSVIGVPVHHYVEIDFVGFAGLVDRLGGVSIDFDHPARDLKSGLSVEAGTQLLDGRAAVAYARSRSYQELQNGSWTAVDANDIGRTGRQQALMISIFDELRSPARLLDISGLVRELGEFMSVDPAFLRLDFVDLALAFRDVAGGSIERHTLPTETSRIDGIFYEIPIQPDADQMIASFASAPVAAVVGSTAPTPSTPPEPPSAEAIRIQVLNGNGRVGAAAAAADLLTGFGFDVVAVGDHDAFDVARTTVLVDDPASASGALVAEALGGAAVEAGATPAEVDVVVIVGLDG